VGEDLSRSSLTVGVWDVISHLLTLAAGAAVGDFLVVYLNENADAAISLPQKWLYVEIAAISIWIFWHAYSVIAAFLLNEKWRRVRRGDALTMIPLLLLYWYSHNHFVRDSLYGGHFALGYLALAIFLTAALKFSHIAAMVAGKRRWALYVLIALVLGICATNVRESCGTNLFRWMDVGVFLTLQAAFLMFICTFVLLSGIYGKRAGRIARGVLGVFVFFFAWWWLSSPPSPQSLPSAAGLKNLPRAGDMEMFSEGGDARRVRIEISGEYRDALVFPASGSVSHRMEITRGAKLSFGTGVAFYNREQSGQGVTFRLQIKDGSAKETVWSRTMNPVQLARDRYWSDATVDLSPYAGGERTLVFDVAGAPFAAISEPVMVNEQAGKPSRPNVLLILVDTLRADHVGAYGYRRNTSPFMDEVASEGVIFKNAVSTAPWTVPATFSLLTGMLPGQADVLEYFKVHIGEKIDLLSELLQKEGYRTAGVSGNFFITDDLGYGQGFETFSEKCLPNFHWMSAKCMTDEGLAWADRRLGQPYFLYMHYVDPHADYRAPKPFRGMFAQGYTGDDERIKRGRIVELEVRHDRTGEPVELPTRDIIHLEGLYDEEIRYADFHLRRLLEGLERRGMLENTLVVMTSDHGEEFVEHGIVGHRSNLHGTLMDVPLIFRGKGLVPTGVKVDDVVSLADVAPTIMEIVGLRSGSPVWGRSLKPLWEGGTLPERMVFGQRKDKNISEWMVTDGKYKFIIAKGKEKRWFNPRFYDIRSDPVEFFNLVGVRKKHEKYHRELLDIMEWIDENSFMSKKGEREFKEEDFRKRLKALGYVR